MIPRTMRHFIRIITTAFMALFATAVRAESGEQLWKCVLSGGGISFINQASARPPGARCFKVKLAPLKKYNHKDLLAARVSLKKERPLASSAGGTGDSSFILSDSERAGRREQRKAAEEEKELAELEALQALMQSQSAAIPPLQPGKTKPVPTDCRRECMDPNCMTFGTMCHSIQWE